jgi:hypothetical protein
MVCKATLPAGDTQWDVCTCEVLTAGSGDHEPVLATTPNKSMQYCCPPPQAQAPFQKEVKFNHFKPDQLVQFRLAFEASVRQRMAQFEDDASTAAHRLKAAHQAARDILQAPGSAPSSYKQAFAQEMVKLGVSGGVVETLAGTLTDLLAAAVDEARNHCDTFQTSEASSHSARRAGDCSNLTP